MKSRFLFLAAIVLQTMLARSLVHHSTVAFPSARSFIMRVSVASDGLEREVPAFGPVVSDNGRIVVYISFDPGNELYVYDRLTQQMTYLPSHVYHGSILYGGAAEPTVSADGLLVAFDSDAYNLVAGDVPGSNDVFVRDLLTNGITRISRATDGTPANGYSWFPALSGNGRLVAFISTATNLDPKDNDTIGDVYIHNRETGQTTLAWKAHEFGAHSVSMTTDGRYLAITDLSDCDPGDCYCHTYVYDRLTGETLDALGEIFVPRTWAPAIADGPMVAFMTQENLLPEDTNDHFDVYRYDFSTEEMALISVGLNGESSQSWSGAPAISDDGRYVAFDSISDNLVVGDTNDEFDVFLWSAEAHPICTPITTFK